MLITLSYPMQIANAFNRDRICMDSKWVEYMGGFGKG